MTTAASNPVTQPVVPPAARRPGGRGERVRRDVAVAVLDLVAEGRYQFSVIDVADRARVHRSTVHRRWPSRAALLGEALVEHTRGLVVPDTGTWRGDLDALVGELAAFFSDPVEIAMNAAMAAATDPDLTLILVDHWLPIIHDLEGTIARAVDRGDVKAEVEPEMVLQLIIGPLLLQTVIMRTTPDERHVTALAEMVHRATCADVESTQQA